VASGEGKVEAQGPTPGALHVTTTLSLSLSLYWRGECLEPGLPVLIFV